MKRVIKTSGAPAAIGPYSQAIEANGTLYISGQLPVNPRSRSEECRVGKECRSRWSPYH